MKKSKLLSSIAAAAICSAIFTGCFPTQQESGSSVNDHLLSNSVSEENSISIQSFANHITDNEIEMLNIDADIVVPEGFNALSEVFSASAHYRQWDGESVISELINNGLISGNRITETDSHENSGPNDMICNYTLDDDSAVSVSSGNILYKTKKYIDCQYQHYFDYYENYLFEDSVKNMFGSEDIEGISKAKAIEESGKIISLLNIDSISGEPEIYSVTSDKIQAVIDQTGAMLDKNGNEIEAFSEDDNAYLVMYPIKYNGIPSSKVFGMGENEIFDCSKAFFIYSKSGLTGFEITGIFEEDNVIESSALFTPESVCGALKDFYNSIILDSPVNISLIKLVFINRNDYYSELKIEPAWLIYSNSIVSEKGDKTEVNFIKFMSALNGDMISVDSIGG